MGAYKSDSAIAGSLTMVDYSVDSEQTDGATGNGETVYINTDWGQNFGYFNQIAELNATINAKATWTIGKGFKAEAQTELLLDTIRGFGKDTFNTILENMIRTYYIGGDAFAEIIRDEEGNLINMKTLDPSTITIVAGENGLIKRYEQNSKTKKSVLKKFKPEEMLHLARNRVADQIHGVSVIASVENIILARNEAITDYRKMMHRHMQPRYIFHLDTDDETEIAKYKATNDAAWKDGENMYVPKDVVVPEQMSIAPNSTLDPKAWIDQQGDFFYEAVGVPQIILGGSGEFTEASAKIAYLAFQQNIEEEQLYIEEQLLSQMNILIELEFPASLENELLSDESKDGAENIDPSETTAGEGQ